MTVGAVDEACGALTFEVEDDVGERAAFEEIVVDGEGARGDFDGVAGGAKGVVAGLLDGGEIGCPEDAVAPVVDLAGGLEVGGEDGFVGVGVDEGELCWMVGVGAFDDGLFGRGGFVADLVYEDF
jgi:hypothetical protein